MVARDGTITRPDLDDVDKRSRDLKGSQHTFSQLYRAARVPTHAVRSPHNLVPISDGDGGDSEESHPGSSPGGCPGYSRQRTYYSSTRQIKLKVMAISVTNL